MTVYNVTDSTTMVAATIPTQIRITGTLSGGTWDNGDEYFIVCPHWKSEPWNCHSVQLTGNARYLSMRGDR